MKTSTYILRTYAFIKGDYLSIWRDSMMMVMFISPLLIGLAIRILHPFVSEQIEHLFKFDITSSLIGIAGFFILLPPLLYGIVAGFIILDERDDGVLQYLTVTPLSRGGYLLYRISMPALAGFVVCAPFVVLCDLLPHFTIKLIPLLFLSASGAPLTALLMATFARNKVEALTMAKATSISFLPALVVFFTDSPFQFLSGIAPSFWIVKGIIAVYNQDPFYPLFIAGGVVITLGYTMVLIRKFFSKVL